MAMGLPGLGRETVRPGAVDLVLSRRSPTSEGEALRVVRVRRRRPRRASRPFSEWLGADSNTLGLAAARVKLPYLATATNEDRSFMFSQAIEALKAPEPPSYHFGQHDLLRWGPWPSSNRGGGVRVGR